MAIPASLQPFRAHPGMYVNPVTSATIASFLNGYDQAVEGGLMLGFREWLIPRVGYGNNLAWTALVNDLRKRDSKEKHNASSVEPDEIEFIFATLEAFLAEREAPDGLRRILLAYEAWLRKQEWYGPDSPHWIPVELSRR